MEDEIDVPHYFICPISLQIMKDPVTTTTGITYDRESIEFWLFTTSDQEVSLCPVTKQPLSRDTNLTPNHTLRRLIQGWCVANANHGIDRIPTPKSPLSKSHVLKLLRNLDVRSLETLDLLANENDKSRKCLAENGTAKGMVLWIMDCFKGKTKSGLKEALRVLHLTWLPESAKGVIEESSYSCFLDSLLWVLSLDVDEDSAEEVKTRAVFVLKMVIETSSTSTLERLKLEFFNQTVKHVLKSRPSESATKAILEVLIEVCPWGRNRMKIVEAGAVFELIELELSEPSKHITELVFSLLAHLCSCADGRAQLIDHAGGIAVVAKRTLRVSHGTDDRAVHILGLIGRFSGTDEVLSEMLRVGAVDKLCMVLQADCAAYLKKNARDILRLHNKVWNNSPCISVNLNRKP